MIKVLIVDDEYSARENLKLLFHQQNSPVFTVAGEADNGKSAIDFLLQHDVDLVICDVCMPVMNGIELAKYIKESLPKVQVVMMSSYSDYDYVRQAFKVSASDYILKHKMTCETLFPLLGRLFSTETRGSNNQPQHENSIVDSVCGRGGSCAVSNAIIAVIRIDNYSTLQSVHTPDELSVLFFNITNHILFLLEEHHGIKAFETQPPYIAVYFPFPSGTSEAAIMNSLAVYIKRINNSIRKLFNIRFSWGISSPSSSARSLRDCYLEAINRIENLHIGDKPYPDETENYITLSIKEENELLAAVDALDENRVNAFLDGFFQKHITGSKSVNVISTEFVAIATKICMEFNVDINKIISVLPKTSDIINGNVSCETFLEWSKQLFRLVIDEKLAQNGISYNRQYSNVVLAYIEKNYSREISLADIAQNVGLSEQHLSRVFKNEIGENISNYLTKYRIEKAKELLLKENINIKYLYSTVGFNTYNYFFIAFKKYTGVTPVQYKKNIQKKAK